MEVKLEKPETAWIGIDQSYSGFGLVVLDGEGNEEFYLWKFKNSGSEAGRLQEIRDKLFAFFIEQRAAHKNCHMVMEGYAHGSRFSREKLGELGGIVKLSWYDAFSTDPTIVPPTVLKKYWTGKGTASKDDMLAAAKIKNSSITNHNIADAYALAHYLEENNDA